MKLGRNLFAGLTNSTWSALITLAVAPLYLRYLGTESFGLIGFFTTTQALTALLDLGLSSSINREVARKDSSNRCSELLHTLAHIYWAIAAIIGGLIVSLSPLITSHWLQPKTLSPETVRLSIILIGIVIACRWPIALYQGALLGAEKVVLQSTINIAMVTLANGGAVLLLIFVSPTIEAYFLWQAVVGFMYVLTIRYYAWKVIGKPTQFQFNMQNLKNIWKFSVGMSGIAFVGIALTQLDKVILSKLLSLEAFGNYMLATLLVSGLYLIITPFYNIIYPRFSYLVFNKDEQSLQRIYKEGTRLLASVIFSIATILVVSSYDILFIWTGNSDVATSTAPIVSILAIGSAMHGVMYFPYALQLAHGKTNLALKIYVVLLMVLLPLIFFFTIKYGAIGGAISWLTLHIFYVLFGTYMTHRELLKNIGANWLISDIGLPLTISIVAATVNYLFLAQNIHFSSIEKLLVSLLVACISCFVSISTSATLRFKLVSVIKLI